MKNKQILKYILLSMVVCFMTGCSKPSVQAEASVTVIGDVMMHKGQIERSYDAKTDSFDISDSFEYVREYLSESDFTIANLETTIAGRNNGYANDIYGYSDYPFFNSPECLVDALKDAGVDFLQTANNHCLDAKEEGLYHTIEYLDQAGLYHTGTFESMEDSKEPCIVEINGISFGFVAYTYGTNGLKTPEDKSYIVNSLEDYDKNKISELYEQVARLDEMGVDVVCSLIHFGYEYVEEANAMQAEITNGLFEHGADVIIGGHPHVLQPFEVRTIKDKNGATKKGYVFYSLGNFISCQTYDGTNRDIGAVVSLHFEKQEYEGKTQTVVSSVDVIPTYVYWTENTIGVIPVLDAQENQNNYDFLSKKDWDRIDFASNYVVKCMLLEDQYRIKKVNDRYVITF